VTPRDKRSISLGVFDGFNMLDWRDKNGRGLSGGL
jgi:hypothetical protein